MTEDKSWVNYRKLRIPHSELLELCEQFIALLGWEDAVYQRLSLAGDEVADALDFA